MSNSVVIAAIDLGPSTARILYHAAAFAQLLGAELKVLHVDADTSEGTRERVLAACLRQGPYQADFTEAQVVIRSGRVSEAITREARHNRAALIVMGSRGHGAVATLVLGSTSNAVLRNATSPVLLVPPIDMDIVSLGDRAALTCGAVVAAVDLTEDSREQLNLASRLAKIASRPLLLMTVARSRTSDLAASALLRDRAHGLEPARPHSLIVRRGAVPEEISRCAVVEGAGLVVMGLRSTSGGRPGAIASAVLRTRRAFVLAVPVSREHAHAVAPATRRRRLALMASVIAALLVGATIVSAQDPRAVVDFQRAADSYAFLHRQVERRIGLAHRRSGDLSGSVSVTELAVAIVAERSRSSEGTLFTPPVVAVFRQLAARASRAPGCDAGELRSGVWEMSHGVHSSATGTTPIAACISAALPALPDELEYRSAGTVLVLVDSHANLVIDVLPALLAGSELRR